MDSCSSLFIFGRWEVGAEELKKVNDVPYDFALFLLLSSGRIENGRKWDCFLFSHPHSMCHISSHLNFLYFHIPKAWRVSQKESDQKVLSQEHSFIL